MMKLNFQNFEQKHFELYNAWFENPTISMALGEIDEEWLNHVLTAKSGSEFAVFSEGEMIAVIGITYPTDLYPYFVINNLAVAPHHFNQGIGSAVIAKLLKQTKLQPGQYWAAYVDFTNLIAQKFLHKNGWKEIRKEDEMIRFEYHPT